MVRLVSSSLQSHRWELTCGHKGRKIEMDSLRRSRSELLGSTLRSGLWSLLSCTSFFGERWWIRTIRFLLDLPFFLQHRTCRNTVEHSRSLPIQISIQNYRKYIVRVTTWPWTSALFLYPQPSPSCTRGTFLSSALASNRSSSIVCTNVEK